MTASNDVPKRDAIMAARVTIPHTVVYRSLTNETVVLNLDTGLYHGLNPTAGRMLDALGKEGSVERAASVLANDYQRPLAEVQGDLSKLCQALLQRGLIELKP